MARSWAALACALALLAAPCAASDDKHCESELQSARQWVLRWNRQTLGYVLQAAQGDNAKRKQFCEKMAYGGATALPTGGSIEKLAQTLEKARSCFGACSTPACGEAAHSLAGLTQMGCSGLELLGCYGGLPPSLRASCELARPPCAANLTGHSIYTYPLIGAAAVDRSEGGAGAVLGAAQTSEAGRHPRTARVRPMLPPTAAIVLLVVGIAGTGALVATVRRTGAPTERAAAADGQTAPPTGAGHSSAQPAAGESAAAAGASAGTALPSSGGGGAAML